MKLKTKINWKNPGWIMVAMWWFGVAILLASGAFLGVGVVGLVAIIRTYFTYQESKVIHE